ncbi:MAG TPA: YoaK family protein [Stenotrophomonas sp.]|jgi:uncharacterized membrane protein YoaK (UPF0700 family)
MKLLPSWVWIGAWVLSAAAGMINVVSYLGITRLLVSHVTGSTSLLGVALAQGDWQAARLLSGLLLAFVMGASISGLLIRDDELQLGRRYGVTLTLIAAMILLATTMFEGPVVWATWILAMACGMLNAMASTYSGSVVRTTHITGMLTDLGICVGHLLRGLPLQARRMILCSLIIGGFFAGSLLGVWLFIHFQHQALYVPATLIGSTGIAYFLYRQWWAPRTRR